MADKDVLDRVSARLRAMTSEEIMQHIKEAEEDPDSTYNMLQNMRKDMLEFGEFLEEQYKERGNNDKDSGSST